MIIALVTYQHHVRTLVAYGADADGSRIVPVRVRQFQRGHSCVKAFAVDLQRRFHGTCSKTHHGAVAVVCSVAGVVGQRLWHRPRGQKHGVVMWRENDRHLPEGILLQCLIGQRAACEEISGMALVAMQPSGHTAKDRE